MRPLSFNGKHFLTGDRFLPGMAIWILFFLILYVLAGQYYVVFQKDIYPQVHLVFEFATIVVAVCVSLMSWYDYRYKHQLRMFILSLTFYTVALIEFAHTVSYFGMPDFITANSANKASTYYIINRLLLGAGLIAAVFNNGRVKVIRRPALFIVFITPAGVLLIGAVAVYLPVLPAMYDTAAGRQTDLKIALEYLSIAMLGLSAVKLMLKKNKDRQYFYLCMALVTGIMSETAFTLYSHAYDTFNLLGHFYQLLSFAFIFKALMDEVVGVLYETNHILEKQREKLVVINRRLEDANRFKDEFLANTNHELRTPLSAIIAFTELLMDQSTGKLNDLQKDYLNEINDSSKELLDRINGFLDLSKIAAGKTVLYKESFEVNFFLEDAARRIHPLFDSKGVVLEVVRNPERLRVHADREKAGRVLSNLLSNALKFTDPGGNVSICAGLSDSGQEVYISVKDSGIGIDPRDLEKIFQPFQQVDGTSIRKYGGLGVGLTLAKKLVELQGGTIDVVSEPYAGSIFTFTLPAEKMETKESLGKVG